MSILWAVGAFILVLSPIVIVHELGHFWTARFFGIKVEEFGLGFPPRAATLFERNGTKYTLNWIPIGGFVRPAGEDDSTVKNGLASASKTARFCVLAAGAFFNFVFAYIILTGAFMYGQTAYEYFSVNATSITKDSVAEAAGLQVNDVFVSVDGTEIGGDVALLQQVVSSNLNNEVDIIVDRAGELVTIPAIPAPSSTNPDKGALGVGLQANGEPTGGRSSLPFVDASSKALSEMWNIVSLTVRVPVMLMQGDLTPAEARPISMIGISQIAGNQAEEGAKTGNWFGLLYFAGLINVALGFTNLLPIPALDGGRIVFVLLEAIRGRRIKPEHEGFVHMVGMLLLFSLLILLMVQDVVNPIIPF